MNTDWIILHCAYTPPDMDIGAAEIRKWHVKDNGWADIGYHYVIRRNGAVENGRPEGQMGAHTKGYNMRSLGICLVGGMREGDKAPDCNFTAAQWASLASLVTDLLTRHPEAKVAGHRDFDPGRACPTFDAKAWATGLSRI